MLDIFAQNPLKTTLFSGSVKLQIQKNLKILKYIHPFPIISFLHSPTLNLFCEKNEIRSTPDFKK